MKIRQVLIVFLMGGGLAFPALAQTDAEDTYSSEFTYGITINTNSGLPGGFIFKKAWLARDRMYHNIWVEIVNVKHPKEYRAASNNNSVNSNYVYDKLNNFYVIRPQYGREIILFRKAPEEGVQIDAILAGGLSIGLLKPYYIEYDYSLGRGTNVVIEPYDPLKHSDRKSIRGSGGFWYGWNQLTVQPGINAKAGLSFEFGAFRSSVTGFEIGVLVDAYTKKIPIMAQPENRSVFTSAYLTVFFGSRK